MQSKQFPFASLLLVLVLLLAACAPAATAEPTQMQNPTMEPTEEPTMAPTEEPTEVIPETSGEEPTLMVFEHPDLGSILVDGEGMTLYMFTKDAPNTVNCAGDCLVNWPPLLTQGNPIAGEGVDESLIGTANMEDGSMIVTYNEMPLYYWIDDSAAGDATGQNVGEVWFVVNPAGEPVGMPEASAADSASMDGTVVNMAEHDELGPILVDEAGMTLYMFTKDEPNKVNCAGDCLVKWPPLLTEGDPVAGEGVDQDLLGTAPMEDGSTIVTYNDMPLYYWVSDMAAGDATGQNVGGVWFVVNPQGDAVGAPAASSSSGAEMTGTVVNMVEDPVLGPILVDEKGMTLYMFTKDEPNKVNCAGDCLVAWPPLLTEGEPVAGEGVDQALLGTAEMADGKLIVTYNEMPLYYWQADTAAGMTTGQDVGGVWYVVNPEGDPVGMDN